MYPKVFYSVLPHPVPPLHRLSGNIIEFGLKAAQADGGEGWLALCLRTYPGTDTFCLVNEVFKILGL